VEHQKQSGVPLGTLSRIMANTSPYAPSNATLVSGDGAARYQPGHKWPIFFGTALFGLAPLALAMLAQALFLFDVYDTGLPEGAVFEIHQFVVAVAIVAARAVGIVAGLCALVASSVKPAGRRATFILVVGSSAMACEAIFGVGSSLYFLPAFVCVLHAVFAWRLRRNRSAGVTDAEPPKRHVIFQQRHISTIGSAEKTTEEKDALL
jgi:hypothetical protein